MKIAMMIIDLQNEYYSGASKASMDQAVEYINAVIPWFRNKNLPILWVQDDETEGNDEKFALIDGLVPLDGEHRITKHYGNSFNKTNCYEILKSEGIDTVLITGYCAEYCVLSTYRGAEDLDLTPVILKNGIASGNASNLQMVENISTLISYNMLKKIMT